MPARSRNLPLSQRGLNFEMLTWLFTRISALVMYALVLSAMIAALIMGARTGMNFADVLRWSFLPNVTHVQSTNLPSLDPWTTTLWKLAASALVLVASSHAVRGLVVIADDYIVTPRSRWIARFLSVLFLVSMIAIGVFVVWTS